MENLFGELPVRRLHQLVAVMPGVGPLLGPAGLAGLGGERRAAEVRLWLAEPLPDPLPALAGAGPPYAAWLSQVHLRHALRCAVAAGATRDGRRVFVARADFRARLLPARVEERCTGAVFGFGGREWTSRRYEVLAVPRGRAEWFEASDGDAPAHAFPACPSLHGETAFVGRARVGGALIPGRVKASVAMDVGAVAVEYFVQERDGSEEMGARWHEATAALPSPPRAGALGPPLPWWARAHDIPPAKPVFVGTDLNGGPLYVGRAWHEGQLLPAKVAPAYQVAFVAWIGREHTKYDDQYEVLHLRRGRAEWVQASDGVLPAHAFPVGITSGGRLAFSARAAVEGIVTPGWIAEGNTRCHVSYGDKEWLFRNYEVLAVL